jgi:hypothetical protein
MSDDSDTRPTRRAQTIWQVNKLVNALMIVVVGLPLVLVLLMFVASLAGGWGDPHGYVGLFSVILVVALLAPLSLLIAGAIAMRGQHWVGFIYQILAGVVIVLYGRLIPDPRLHWTAVGVGFLLGALGVLGLLYARPVRPPRRDATGV